MSSAAAKPALKRLLTTREAGIYLGASAWKVRQLVATGQLAPVILGDDNSGWRFDLKDLDTFIDAHKER